MAYRSGDWILIPPYSGPETNLTGNELGNLPEGGLFNIRKDLGQQQNLLSTDRAKYDQMKSRFLEITKEYYNPETEEIELK